MNTEEAKLIEEKLQGILKSIEDYGNQVEQFGKTRIKLDDALETQNKLSFDLRDLTINCNNLINDVKEKIYDNTFAAIKEETEKIQKTANELKTDLDRTSGQIIQVTSVLQSGINDLVTSFGETFNDLKNKLEQMKKSSFDMQTILKRDIESSEERTGTKIDNLNKASTIQIESLKKELTVQKTLTKKEISTNRKILTVGLCVLGIILILSIVGLLI